MSVHDFIDREVDQDAFARARARLREAARRHELRPVSVSGDQRVATLDQVAGHEPAVRPGRPIVCRHCGQLWTDELLRAPCAPGEGR